jgi:hypothetical protein
VAGVYVPRSPTSGVLYGVVRTHLADFLAAVDARTDGSGLPPFVTAEFRKFLRCGVLAHGFARVRCGDCASASPVTPHSGALRLTRQAVLQTPWRALLGFSGCCSW